MRPLFLRTKKPWIGRIQGFFFSAPGETRTPNLLIRSQMLYPIELRALLLRIANCEHYGLRTKVGISDLGISRMGGTRLELVTSTMSTWRSNQLS